MVTVRTAYPEATVFKTMQRMKEEPCPAPFLRLESASARGFRVASPVSG
jgi:hypothetical protein